MTTGFINSNIRDRQKTYLIVAVKLLIAAGILFYLITYIDYRDIVNALSGANVYLIAAAFSLTFLNIYLQFLKWKLTCNSVMSEKNNGKILTSIFYGLSAGAITPVRIGEYFGRAIAFKNKPLLQVTAATLIDKFFLLIIVTSLGSVASLVFIYMYYDVSLYIVLSLFIIVFTLFYMVALIIQSEKFWDNVFFARLRNSNHLRKFLNHLGSLRNLDRKYAGKMTVISLLFYFCFIVQYALLVAAFSHNSDYLSYLWAGNLIIFVKTAIPQISLGELGIREGASVFFLTSFDELPSVAFNASIFLFVINIMLPALVGLFLLIRKNDD
ncbi:MAG: flippase-like domain-containing protein [Ignavibacterium sp.]|nr:MAG: flippase-like domain-containing protein [Ignavibacterium sp.]